MSLAGFFFSDVEQRAPYATGIKTREREGRLFWLVYDAQHAEVCVAHVAVWLESAKLDAARSKKIKTFSKKKRRRRF